MDLHCFDADPDPDPAQNLYADPDPDPKPDPGGGGGVGQPKMCIPPGKFLGTPLVPRNLIQSNKSIYKCYCSNYRQPYTGQVTEQHIKFCHQRTGTIMIPRVSKTVLTPEIIPTENSYFEELEVFSEAVKTCHGAENKGSATRQHNKMFFFSIT